MFWLDLLFAVVVAIVLTAVFAGGLRRVGPWEGLLWFFLIILFAAWVGGAWMRPIGPPLWGVYWVPFLWFGLLVALLLAAATPSRPPRTREEAAEQAGAEAAAAGTSVALGVFFWLLLIGLLLTIIISYFVP